MSAAAWYDPIFPDQPKVSPFGYANSALGAAGQWPSDTKRYCGSSGEFVDAFVDLGPVPLNIKLGRTSVVWGSAAAPMKSQPGANAQAPVPTQGHARSMVSEAPVLQQRRG